MTIIGGTKKREIKDSRINEASVLNAPVPLETRTYKPVSNSNLLNALYEKCDQHGLVVKSKDFWSGAGGNQMIAKLNIAVKGVDDMGMMLALRNSYDKSMSFGLAAGGNVWICSNGMMSGDMTYRKVHKGGIVKEVDTNIITAIDQLEGEFTKLHRHAEKMKDIEMNRNEAHKLYGELFFENQLTTTQLNLVRTIHDKKLDYKDYTDFGMETAWDYYNHGTEALKIKNTAMDFVSSHKALHSKFATALELD